MNALEIKNYFLYGERKREEFQQKIEGLLEKKEWHTIDVLIRNSDSTEAPLSELKKIILDVSKVAAEKMNLYEGSFDYINDLFCYWKGIAGVKKDKEIDSFIKTLEVAFEFDKIDNKEFYTPEMHFISDCIEEEEIKLEKFAARSDISIITGYVLFEHIKQIIKHIKKKKDGFTLYYLYDKVKDSLHNKSTWDVDLEESLKGYLFAFTINKLEKNGLIRRG